MLYTLFSKLNLKSCANTPNFQVIQKAISLLFPFTHNAGFSSSAHCYYLDQGCQTHRRKLHTEKSSEKKITVTTMAFLSFVPLERSNSGV